MQQCEYGSFPRRVSKPSFMLCEQGGGGVEYNENNFKKKKEKKKLTKEQFKLKYRNQSKEQTLV